MLTTITQHIRILFLILFVGYVSTPMILNALEKLEEISVAYGVNEEEMEGEEKDVRPLTELDQNGDTDHLYSKFIGCNKCQADYHLTTFKELHLESIYPPPELI